MLKTHAPNSSHHAIHVNCVLNIGLHLQSVQPNRAGYGNGSKSERGAKYASQTLRDYIAFAFAMWISHQACIDWTILSLGKLILSVFLREEVNWLNYWKCRVKLSGNRGKYGTSSERMQRNGELGSRELRIFFFLFLVLPSFQLHIMRWGFILPQKVSSSTYKPIMLK